MVAEGGGEGQRAVDYHELLEQLTEARGHEARVPVRERIRALGDDAVPLLLAGLEHPDCFTRWEAVSLLGELAPPTIALRLVAFALGEDEVHARWRSYWAVTRFDPAVTVPALLAALDAGDATRRFRAALILSMLGRPEAAPAVREALGAREHFTRWEALSALRALRVPGTEDELASFLAVDYERDLRQEAVLALGALGTAAARQHLEAALADGEPQVRWRASMALARGGVQEVLPPLRARLAVETDAAVARQLREDIQRLERSPAP